MSFGFSVSDVILLIELTSRAVDSWNSACGRYAKVTADLTDLENLLKQIEREAEAPDSLLVQNAIDAKGWKHLFKSCRTTVTRLEDIINKYKSLGTDRRKNWDRIRMGNENLESLNIELIKRITSLSAFVSVLGLRSQRRVENEILPELIQRIDHLALLSRKGGATISTAWTEYEDDDKGFWREFRRELRHGGFSGSVIHQHRAALQTYLAKLQREGKLDEETLPSEHESDEERYVFYAHLQ